MVRGQSWTHSVADAGSGRRMAPLRGPATGNSRAAARSWPGARERPASLPGLVGGGRPLASQSPSSTPSPSLSACLGSVKYLWISWKSDRPSRSASGSPTPNHPQPPATTRNHPQPPATTRNHPSGRLLPIEVPEARVQPSAARAVRGWGPSVRMGQPATQGAGSQRWPQSSNMRGGMGADRTAGCLSGGRSKRASS
jgi:hypothetical protein